MFDYRNVAVRNVIDGDSVRLSIDMGNHIRWEDNFRLRGIDTPEKGHQDYEAAADYLRTILLRGIVRAETSKPDKFGRWLVDLYVGSEHGGELHVNALMLMSGLAKPYDGGKK